ncbi:MAG: glycosyltransferase family 2 protein [Chloroflexota bacterium]
MKPRITVIVVNWNGVHLLSQCLDSLARQTFGDAETIVVDNGSVDGSVGYLRQHFPGVRVLANESNLGFARANNQAIAASESEFLALLNNDAWVEPSWLQHLLAEADARPAAGSFASKMVFAQAPEVINSTGISIDRAGIAWDRLGGAADAAASQVGCEIFGACAGAALYRRAMLSDIGCFDDDFFAYLEDVDLAWRARLRGWSSFYVPSAKVYHQHSATGGEGSPFKNYLLGRNKLWTIIKNYPMPEMVKYIPLIALYDALSVQYSVILRGDWSPLRGRMAGLAGLRALLGKRRLVQSRRTVSFSDIARLVEPVVRPDLVARRYRHILRVKKV